jgi:hypothetical protein
MLEFCVIAEHGVPGEAIAEAYDAFEKGQVVSPLAAAAVSNQTIQESMRLVLLVRAFQVSGPRKLLYCWFCFFHEVIADYDIEC